MSRRHITNLDELAFAARPAAMGTPPEGYEVSAAYFSASLGAQKLGYNVTKLPSGNRAYPFHSHQVNEELFFILNGSGEVRMGSERLPIRTGDFIACPPGGPETAHQIVNTGSEELSYLSVSTKQAPEIAEYPDSGKFGVMGEARTGEDGAPAQLRFLGRTPDSLGYWEGEK